MPTHLLLEGEDIESVLAQLRESHGPDAKIIQAEMVRVGGFGGFFAKRRYEVTVEIDDDQLADAMAEFDLTELAELAELSEPAGLPDLADADPRALVAPADLSGIDALLSAAERQDYADLSRAAQSRNASRSGAGAPARPSALTRPLTPPPASAFTPPPAPAFTPPLMPTPVSSNNLPTPALVPGPSGPFSEMLDALAQELAEAPVWQPEQVIQHPRPVERAGDAEPAEPFVAATISTLPARPPMPELAAAIDAAAPDVPWDLPLAADPEPTALPELHRQPEQQRQPERQPQPELDLVPFTLAFQTVFAPATAPVAPAAPVIDQAPPVEIPSISTPIADQLAAEIAAGSDHEMAALPRQLLAEAEDTVPSNLTVPELTGQQVGTVPAQRVHGSSDRPRGAHSTDRADWAGRPDRADPADPANPANPVADRDRLERTLTQLAALGVPERLLGLIASPDPVLALREVTAALGTPRLPAWQPSATRGGALIAVVGTWSAARSAVHGLINELGTDPAAVLAVAASTGAELPSGSSVRSHAAAVGLVQHARQVNDVTVLVIDPGHTKRSAVRAAETLSALEPQSVLVAVDACTDLGTSLLALDALDQAEVVVHALALDGVSRAVRPAAALEIPVPISWIDGRLATQGSWLGMLVDRMASRC